MKKRILSMLLVFVMLLGMMPGTAFVANATEREKVYISVSYDGQYINDQNGAPMAYIPVDMEELARIDLTEYGLGEGAEYDYRYDADGDGNYEITALHLSIYAHEKLFGGSWSDVTFTGSPGSSYFQGGIFGFDENLNYYVNGEYPLAGTGWGATSDQIVIDGGDFVDIASYTSWSFYSDPNAGFHYFMDGESITHAYTATAGEALTVTLGRAAQGGDYNTVLITESPDSYWDGSYNTLPMYYGTELYADDALAAEIDESGQATITFDAAGTYYLWADGGCGSSDDDYDGLADAVSSPAYAVVTVTASPEPENTAPTLAEGMNATATANIEVGDEYTVDLSTIFTDADGDALTYTVSVNGGAAVAVDAQYSYTPDTTGTVNLVFTANDGMADSVNYTVALTVTAPIVPLEGTVYISISDDAEYISNAFGMPMTYVPVELNALTAINLDEYDLSDYKYDADGDGSYEITALHLYIYVHEQVMGLDWSSVDCSNGSPGSMYFSGGIFGFSDENLRYNYNGAYPANEEGWGITADQLVLSAGDFLDVAHFSDWNFYMDSGYGFCYFYDSNDEIVHAYTATAGETLTVALKRVSGGMGMGDMLIPEGYRYVNCGTAYGAAIDTAETDDNGEATFTFSEAGTYYIWADGGEGVDMAPGAIVSTPAYAVVTVEAAPEPENTAPTLVEGVNAITTANIEVGDEYTVDLSTIFTDADGDTLTYKVSVNGASAVAADSQYSYTPDVAGTVTLVFTANDGEADSETYTVTLSVTDTNREAADAVEVLIAAIGEVTLDSEEAITAARAAYEALTETQKALVENYAVLTAAETKLAELKATAADQAAVDAVEELIAAIGEVTLDSEEAITAARAAYDALTETQKVLVENYAVLTAAEVKLAELKATAADQAAAVAVEELIAAIGEVTLDSEEAIIAARSAYEALTETQKALVENYAVLTAAETKLAELKATAEDQAAADAVEMLIATIGEVTLDSEDEITAARAAYNALTETQKALVENYAVLTAAETKLAELKVTAADQAAADAVEELIAAIGEVTLDSEEAIIAARSAYDALTETQKVLVENYAVLTAAETKLADLKAAAADQAAADAVEALIAAIGEVTLDSEDEITAARAAYDALTETQKVLVENYAVLTAAETKFTELKEEADKPEEPALNWQEVMAEVKNYLTEQAEDKAPIVSSTKGEWLVLGLARAGVSADSEFFAKYYENVVKYVGEKIDASGRLHASKSTDNARVILALTAIGKDVTNVGGHNLLEGLSNSDYVKKQGINGPVWALIALDSGKYEIPTDADSSKQVTREWLIEYILSNQLANGGWALSGQTPDDMTPMTIQALAPYYESDEAVKEAVDKAINAMAGMVDESFDAGNSETLAQIIVALSAMGIDADTDSRFSKEGVSVVDALLRYSLEGGTFQHGMGGGANQMATEQGFYALVAYDRFKNGKTSLYNMSDALAEKYSVTVGEVENGTVTVDKSSAIEGETVTVTVSAHTGYKLESLKMNGAALSVADGKATFTMPAANVTITATFAKLDTVIEQETIVEDGSATVEIGEDALKEAAEAVDEENPTITITPTQTEDAEKVEVKLPAQTVGEIGEETDASIVVQAPAATVEIANEILGTITKDATAESVVSLIVEEQDAAHVEEKTDEKLDTNGAVIVEVTLTVDGEKKTEFGNEKLTIFIPLSDNFREGMIYDVVVISDGRANETHRSECRKVDGKLGVEIKINHLSTFVVLDSAVSELLDAMVKLEVKDASKATYDKIMAIEAAYDALTNVQQDSLEDAYDEFCEKVDDFEDYLDEAIEDALDDLDDYYDSLDKDDYSNNNWSNIKDTRKWAKEEIKKASYQEKVDEILNVALEIMKSVDKSGEITVTFRLIGDFQHDNGVTDHDSYVTWIETTEFEMESGDTMYDLFMAAMDEFGLSQRGASNNYVETIQAPDILGGYWLGEFDNGVNSGWMYTVNGVHPNAGLCYYELKDGDEVIWHYVDDYKLEERNPSSGYYYRWLEAKDIAPEDYVDELAKKILTVGNHGKVDPAKLDSDDIGRNVTFRFKPDDGYKVENVIVDGKSMGSIESFTYKKLSLDSRITVSFVKKDTVEVNFDDVSENDWFYEDVQFVVEQGLFNGTDDDVFSPTANMTRAMLVTVLYRLEGEPSTYGTNSFTDVRSGQWYTDAVIWAAKNGIVSGYDNGLFGTNDNVTREQMAAILYRYASYKGYNVTRSNSLSQYADADEIHSYALAAMKWANAVGLINGRTNSTLVPGGTATRAEVAAIFHRFVENLVP